MWIVLGVSHISDKKFIKKFLIAGFSVVAGYLPWLMTFMKQFHSVQSDYWIPETSVETIKTINWWILSDNRRIRYLFFMMFLIVIVYSVYRIALHRNGSKYGIIMMFMPYILVLISIGISKIYRPILVWRYIVPAMGIAGMGELLFLRKLFQEKKMIMKIVASFFCIMAISLSLLNTSEWMKEEKSMGDDWDKMINAISVNDGNCYLYIENGQPMVRPLTVMFPEAVHISENANMTEYNQFLFGTQDYGECDINEPVFIITASNYSMETDGSTEYLGTYNTWNGEYSVYIRK